MNKNIFYKALIFLGLLGMFGWFYNHISDIIQKDYKLIIAYWAFAIGNAGSIANWISSILEYLFSKPGIYFTLNPKAGGKDVECTLMCYNPYDFPFKLISISSNEYRAEFLHYLVKPKEFIDKEIELINNNETKQKEITFTITYYNPSKTKHKTIKIKSNNPFYNNGEV